MRRSFKAPSRKTPLFKSIEEFTRGRELGSGAFATVFEVIHKLSGVRYAMKQINLSALSSMDQENVEKELEIHVRIDHAHIIQLHDFLVEDSYVYLILEYASRGNLFKHMNRKRITENDIRKFFVQTAVAIEYLHTQQVIMRDLKPENLLLDHNYTIKLCDLGWAACLSDAAYCRVKAGTYAYMSPESLLGLPQGEKSDIWSLGILLYELCYNKEPYTGQSCQEQLNKIRTTPLSFPGPINPDAQLLIVNLLKEKADERLTMDKIFESNYLRTYLRENHITRPRRSDDGKSKFLSNGVRSQIGLSLSQLARQLNDSRQHSTSHTSRALPPTSIQQQVNPAYSFTSQSNYHSHRQNLVQSSLHLSSHTDKGEQNQRVPIPKLTSIDQITKINTSLPTTSVTSSSRQIINTIEKPTIYKSRIYEQETNQNKQPSLKTHTYSYISKHEECDQISPVPPEKPRPPLRGTHALTPEVHAKNFHPFSQSTVDNSKTNIQTPQVSSSRSPLLTSKYRNFQQPTDNSNKGFAYLNFNSNNQVGSSRVISSRVINQESRPSNNEQVGSTSVSNFDAKSFTNNFYRKARRVDQDSTNANARNPSLADNSPDDSRSLSPHIERPIIEGASPFLCPILKMVPFTSNPKYESVSPYDRSDSASRKVVFFSKSNGILSERPVSVDTRTKNQANVQVIHGSHNIPPKAKQNTTLSHKMLPPNNYSSNYNIYMNPTTPQPSTKTPDGKHSGKDGLLTNIYCQTGAQFLGSRSGSQQIGKHKPNIFVNIDLNN